MNPKRKMPKGFKTTYRIMPLVMCVWMVRGCEFIAIRRYL